MSLLVGVINLCLDINRGSIKQCVEPESTRALKITKSDRREVITERNKASGLKGAEALRRTSLIARSGSTQPSVRAESKRLLSIFLSPQPKFLRPCRTCRIFLLLHGLWLSQQRKRILDILWQSVLRLHRRDRDYWQIDELGRRW